MEKYSEGKIHKTTLFTSGNTELSVATGTYQQMQSKCSCSTVIIPKPSRVNEQGQFPQISINATVEALRIRQNLTLRAHSSEAYGDWMERSQRKIHRKDELTWPAQILTCSPHVVSHVLALNGTSLLAVTCPCKNQARWPFWCPYRNVGFSA